MKFDESLPMPHSSARMHKLVLGTLMLLLSLLSPLKAAERSMTLQECIAEALRHNLGLQVSRISLDITRYQLGMSYSAWEPTLNSSYNHNFSSTPGGLDSQNRAFVGSETDTDSFSTGIGGLLPWGTRYNLGFSGSDSYGSRGGLGTDTNQMTIVTNALVDISTGHTNLFLGTNFGLMPITTPFQNANARAGALTLTQPLLRDAWIDSARLNVSISKRNLKTTELGFRSAVEALVFNVENAYYDLIAAREQVKVQEQAVQLAEQLLAENKKRVEVGALAPLDEKQAESQVASSRATLLSVKQILNVRENVLKSLLTDDYAAIHEVILLPKEVLLALPQMLNLKESWNRGLTLRPDVLTARINLEKQDIQLRYNRNQLFPILDVTGSIGYTGTGQELSDAFSQISGKDNQFWSVGVTMSVPLGNRAARENYKISKATKTQLVLQLKSLEQSVMTSIDDAIKLAQSSFEAVDATRQARSFAEAALDAEQKKLENGKSTSFQVLQLQTDLTDARSREIAALATYNRALAALAQQEGTILDRHKVTFDVVK
jgi:outer membrane protein TolC